MLWLPPWLYLALLAGAVTIGMPAGFLVVAAGALFGPQLGLSIVLTGQAVGLMLNWWLCRGVLRPRIQVWLGRRSRGRPLQRLLHRPASLRLMLLLRLALIPMNLVNVACALGPTSPRSYALACLMLVPRFALLVLAGSIGAEAARGSISSLTLISRGVALVATAALMLVVARKLRRGLQHPVPEALEGAVQDTDPL